MSQGITTLFARSTTASAVRRPLFATLWTYLLLLSINLLQIQAMFNNTTSINIDSYIPHDGFQLHYRLEGSARNSSPVLVFSNGMNTDLRIWNGVIPLLKQRFPDFRFLRYDTRGYHPGGLNRTLDLKVLSWDIESLMDALSIQKAHAVIGVSLGGTTAVTFAIQYPDRLNKFVTCDIFINATLANSTAVDPRVAAAEKNGIASIAAELVAGWFTPKAKGSPEWNDAIAMVSAASVAGMAALTPVPNGFYQVVNVKDLRKLGFYEVGAQDNKTISFMENFVAANTPNAGLHFNAGSHLNMWENPSGWVDVVEGFLRV